MKLGILALCFCTAPSTSKTQVKLEYHYPLCTTRTTTIAIVTTTVQYQNESDVVRVDRGKQTGKQFPVGSLIQESSPEHRIATTCRWIISDATKLCLCSYIPYFYLPTHPHQNTNYTITHTTIMWFETEDSETIETGLQERFTVSQDLTHNHERKPRHWNVCLGNEIKT